MTKAADTAEYEERKRAKIERGLAQAQGRATLIPIERILDELGADARAEADVRAGRLVSHGAVKRWVASFSDAVPLARPRPGD